MVPMEAANQYNANFEAKLKVFAWVFDTLIEYTAFFYTIPEPPKLLASSYSGDGRTIQLSIEDETSSNCNSRSGTVMVGFQTPVEELLSSELEDERALGLLILGLDLEPIREKAMRFKEANDFVM